MAYTDMLADFRSILNRNDCTDAQARTFLDQGIRRVQREVRFPSQERLVQVNPTVGVALTQFTIPGDMLVPIDVFIVEGSRQRALVKLSYRDLLAIPATNDAAGYARHLGTVQIRGTVPGDCYLLFHYFGDFTAFVNDADENELSAAAPDLGVYAGLIYGGRHFQSDLLGSWTETYKEVLNEMRGLMIDTDAEGGPQAMQPMYGGDE